MTTHHSAQGEMTAQDRANRLLDTHLFDREVAPTPAPHVVTLLKEHHQLLSETCRSAELCTQVQAILAEIGAREGECPQRSQRAWSIHATLARVQRSTEM